MRTTMLTIASAVLIGAATLAATTDAGADETRSAPLPPPVAADSVPAARLAATIGAHEARLAELDAGYREAVRVARNQLVAELGDQVDDALQAEDLESAMHASAALKEATASLDAVRVVGPSVAGPDAPLRILEARWGMGTRWRDVTERVTASVKPDGIDLLCNHRTLGDPAPRWKKTLFVAYERGGELHVVVVAEDRRLRLR